VVQGRGLRAKEPHENCCEFAEAQLAVHSADARFRGSSASVAASSVPNQSACETRLTVVSAATC
jgi:hypothetical protein